MLSVCQVLSKQERLQVASEGGTVEIRVSQCTTFGANILFSDWYMAKIEMAAAAVLHLLPVKLLVTWYTWVRLLQLSVKFGVSPIVLALTISLAFRLFSTWLSFTIVVIYFWICDHPRSLLGSEDAAEILYQSTASLRKCGDIFNLLVWLENF